MTSQNFWIFVIAFASMFYLPNVASSKITYASICAVCSCLCMHCIALCLLGESYQVTITSSPPSPIPFDYGNINLTCSISPSPPAPVYYTWTNIYQQWSTPTYVNKTPTATLYVHAYEAPRFPIVYCHVHSGNTFIAGGKIILQLQGKL